MAEHVYEGMFILDSNRYARDPAGVSGKILELVEKCGAQMLASRLWNEQKLAYPIKGQRKGTYWLTYFRMDSGQLAVLNRECQLTESILRNLILKVDSRLEKALVEHARQGTAATDDPPEASSETKASENTAEPATEKSATEAATS